MPNPEQLSCISMIICDAVYRDAATGKQIIIGTFNNIWARRLPCRHESLIVLFTLTNAHGEYDLKLRIQHERTGTVMEMGGPLRIDDPLAITDIDVRLDNLVFREEGKYWIDLEADGTPLLGRPFHVRIMKESDQ